MATSGPAAQLDLGTIAQPPSLMEWGFNANKASNADVARNFISVRHLETMAAHDHVILTGPRGSGKTTLLKMMTREALDEWGHRLAQRLIDRDELAFYVGSDLLNRSQLESASKTDLIAESNVLAQVTDIKLTYEVLRTILKSLLYEVSRRRLSIDDSRMVPAIQRLCAQWAVSPTIHHPEALLDSLGDALIDCSRAIHRATLGDASELEATAATRRLASMADLLPTAQEVLARVFTGMPSRWTFLFDDIEYVPLQSQRTILELQRKLPVTFGVKVAITPLSYTRSYLDEITPSSGMYMGHDFQAISLGYQDSDEIERFTTELQKSYIEKYLQHPEKLAKNDVKDAFGSSVWDHRKLSLDESIEADLDLISRLSATQPRFARWAREQSVATADQIRALTLNQRASKIRQPRQIMMLWEEYLVAAADERSPRNRSRSRRRYVSRPIYCGWPVFQLLGDGNPRISTFMIDTLLKSYAQVSDEGSVERTLQFTADQQSEAIWRALSIQENLTNAVQSRHSTAYRGKSPLLLFWEICDYLRDRLYFGEKFVRYPITEIKIDQAIPEALGDAFVDMVYTGFLVDLTPQDDLTPGSFLRPGSDLTGRVFRPSYLVSAEAWLPIRRGKEVNLSTILNRGGDNLQDVMF